jgi:hypothetical protein
LYPSSPPYLAFPQDHLGVSAGSFKTVERELVFDIDLTDYDDVRTCCRLATLLFRRPVTPVLDCVFTTQPDSLHAVAPRFAASAGRT